MEGKMSVDLYKAAKVGKGEFLQEENPRESFLSKTHQGNNIFQIAARHGHKSFVEKALGLFSDLFDQQNSKGDTPLHVAARFGHLEVVKLLVEHYKSRSSQRVENRAVGTRTNSTHGRETEAESSEEYLSSQREEDGVVETQANSTHGREIGEGSSEESLPSQRQGDRVVGTHPNSEPEEAVAEEVFPQLWRVTNLERTTALHEALRNGKEDVSLYLLELDPDMACYVNGAGESLLYLAAESRCEKVMEQILNSDLPFSVEGPHGQNPLHAAKFCNEKSITLLLEKRPVLAKQGDDRGKTALHYAVEGQYWWLNGFLVKKNPSVACLLDQHGLTPLLRASTMGYWWACCVIVKSCPESTEARNIEGQNAVHLFKGRFLWDGKMFLKIPEIRELINERDDKGNTPLHLAIQNHNYKMARLLVSTGAVDLRAINKEGLTALDLCEVDWKTSYKQRRMWYYLMTPKATRGRHPNQSEVPRGGPKTLYTRANANSKEMASTLSLIAILLATITFAAAFTMPGGYNSSGDNLGVAVLIKKAALRIFVLSDTFAMCCSITVVFFLMWAMVGEPELIRALTNFSRNLIKYALYGTLVGFVSGLYAVTASEALWVAILVCVMGSIVPFVVSSEAVMGFATGIWQTVSMIVPPAGNWGRKRKRTARPVVIPPQRGPDQSSGDPEDI